MNRLELVWFPVAGRDPTVDRPGDIRKISAIILNFSLDHS